MSSLAAAGDTWGISGTTFLSAYIVIATAVWVAASRARRALADRRPDRLVADLSSRPHDVAHLNGGPDLAVYSALSSMHVSGTIVTAGRGNVLACGRPEAGTDELERAIHLTAVVPVPRHRLRFHRVVGTALAAVERRLTDAGLLLNDGERRSIQRVGLWMLAVAGLGLVRLLAGVAAARPVGFLVVALFAVTAVAAVQLIHAPRRSRFGDRTLARLRDEHHSLSPAMKPDWAANGATGAALGVGVFGMSALWASDPAFADELAAQKVAAASEVGGGYGGTVDSGGGGGGG
ncbi:TIGR04222 domain-containing membrane protein [Pseudonocardia acidicola]|uniref:TIGR04222 domain-containing membrane protein n=1 Tax=Pseudonocardia acidicola TaxID=2724939 RepID=A0ABX1SFF5_9PSEU|nr:TIGR04222 domain-containing membrane protein [Pseudonocardia acidicola]NMH99840.1 TIGR04222 domain-containing membrane protein [Pseudonocardia acidicola]